MENASLYESLPHEARVMSCAHKQRTQARGALVNIRQSMLQYIIDYKIAHNGNSPEIREIAEAFGTVPSAVSYHLSVLEAGGLIERQRNTARMITVPGYAFVKVTT